MKTTLLIFGVLALTVSAAVLKDGVYSGKAGGRKGPLRVVVTVEGGRIAEVEVTSHREARTRKSIKEIPRRIVKANSADVDAVTGATGTSNAIKAAVKNALKRAR